jgi:hypothetical protein
MAAAMEHRRNSLAALRPILAGLSDAERDAVWHEIEEAMRQFEGVDGIVLPHERLLAVGTRRQ